ncbi:MAG: LCP family protein [Anaerolineae bacterium]
MMDRLIELCKWLVFIGIVALVLVGVVAWASDSASQGIVVVTPTPLPATPLPPTDTRTPTVMTEPPPTWTATVAPTKTPVPTGKPTLIPTVAETATPTETPEPGPIVLPDGRTLPELAGTPVLTSSLPQPSPMPQVEQPDGTINVLLLGMDRTSGDSIARTDVLAIASVFPDGPSVGMLSIPRDYYAWIPGWGLDKINTAYLRAGRIGYPGGGPALAKDTMMYNFGVPIHYYALVDFSSYRQIVDAVGGVDVVVECPFHDTYPDPESPTGQTDIDLEPGVHHLDGKHALWYVRSRWNTSDFDRHRRQQQVLRAILRQALNANMLVRVPELWDVYKEAVETDMGLKEVVYLASVAGRLDERDIHSYFIRGNTLLESWTAPNGGYVLVPHYDVLQEFVQQTMYPLSTSRASQRAYRVEVVNGSGRTGWGTVAAYRLGLEGLIVTAITEAEPQPRTYVTDFTTTSKGSPLWKLRDIYRLSPGDVASEPTEDAEVDFRVTLGWNYNPCQGTDTAYWRPTPTPTPIP